MEAASYPSTGVAGLFRILGGDMTGEHEAIIASLVEANNTLQEELKQARNTVRVLRAVHRALRSANESLRRQIELAAFNDETFKKFCQGEFDAKGTSVAEGGLPEPTA